MREPNAVHDKLRTDEDEEGNPLHIFKTLQWKRNLDTMQEKEKRNRVRNRGEV